MYIDERLLKILDTHKGETVDVNFMISLIKTIAEEHETEQLRIASVVGQSESLAKNRAIPKVSKKRTQQL